MDLPESELTYEYVPYTRNDPRRSSRRSIAPRSSSVTYNQAVQAASTSQPRRGRPVGSKNKSQPPRTPTRQTGTRRSTRRSVASYARDPSVYTEPTRTEDIDWKKQCWTTGFIRLPTPDQVMKMVDFGDYIQRKRIAAFKVIVNVIPDEEKADRIQGYIGHLEWALDPNNVKETDLPSLNNRNVADIGVWITYFGSNFCEIYAQIIDACTHIKKHNPEKNYVNQLNVIKRDIAKKRKDLKKFIEELNLSADAIKLCRKCDFLSTLLDE